MSKIAFYAPAGLSPLLKSGGEPARMRFMEFFTAQIRNANTRRSYLKAPT